MPRLEEVFNQAQVQYQKARNPNSERCGNCEHWTGKQGSRTGTSGCRVVSGDIKADWWCILWNSRKNVDATFGDPDKREYDQGAVGDITARLTPAPEPRAGVIAPRVMRGEALDILIADWGEDLADAPDSIHALIRSLLVEIEEEGQFTELYERISELGVPDLPTWETALREASAAPGLGDAADMPHSMMVGGTYSPQRSSRKVKGMSYFSLKPPREAPVDANRAIQGRINSRRGMARRIQAAKDWHRSQTGDKFHRALGRYNRSHSGRINMKPGEPQHESQPWFHAKADLTEVGGVPCIQVENKLLICSGTLPRSKYTEGREVWAYNGPLGLLDMHLNFAKLTEGMETVRPWLKRNAKTTVLGIPTEGIVVIQEKKKTGFARTKRALKFCVFDSLSGYEAMQAYQIDQCRYRDTQEVLAEAVTYGVVRADSVDMIVDRVVKKLNMLNSLDTLQDTVFDTKSESLYVMLHPEMTMEEIENLRTGMATEYPETKLLSTPTDPDSDWWVMWIPKPGAADAEPNLDEIMEPRADQPCPMPTAPEADILDKAIKSVAARV